MLHVYYEQATWLTDRGEFQASSRLNLENVDPTFSGYNPEDTEGYPTGLE